MSCVGPMPSNVSTACSAQHAWIVHYALHCCFTALQAPSDCSCIGRAQLLPSTDGHAYANDQKRHPAMAQTLNASLVSLGPLVFCCRSASCSSSSPSGFWLPSPEASTASRRARLLGPAPLPPGAPLFFVLCTQDKLSQTSEIVRFNSFAGH